MNRYITSRGFELPSAAEEFCGTFYFNMWSRRNWPYNAVMQGDLLYWYESPTRTLVWRSMVARVDRFEYSTKRDADRRITAGFGDFDRSQSYFVDAPNAGYCLVYRPEGATRISIVKPDAVRFPMLGWLRDQRVIDDWLKQT